MTSYINITDLRDFLNTIYATVTTQPGVVEVNISKQENTNTTVYHVSPSVWLIKSGRDNGIKHAKIIATIYGRPIPGDTRYINITLTAQ